MICNSNSTIVSALSYFKIFQTILIPTDGSSVEVMYYNFTSSNIKCPVYSHEIVVNL